MALRLTRGEDSLVLSPADGGAIVGWTRAGRHMLRRPSPEAVLAGEPGAMACFPLVPYCNRIAYRRFAWNGQTHDLAANFGGHPHAIHGIGWQRAWTVESAAPDRATLSLRHTPGTAEAALAWPFAFMARLAYTLTDAGLTIEIAATNTHPISAPMGLGVHPYFPRDGRDTLAFAAAGVWHVENNLPATHTPIQAAWNHARPRALDAEPLDHCFTGWDGEAHLPGLTVSADPLFGCLQVYTPPGETFFCAEPVSHIPNAPNHEIFPPDLSPDLLPPGLSPDHLPALPPDQAMTVLAPGETLRGAIHLTPTPRLDRNAVCT